MYMRERERERERERKGWGKNSLRDNQTILNIYLIWFFYFLIHSVSTDVPPDSKIKRVMSQSTFVSKPIIVLEMAACVKTMPLTQLVSVQKVRETRRVYCKNGKAFLLTKFSLWVSKICYSEYLKIFCSV